MSYFNPAGSNPYMNQLLSQLGMPGALILDQAAALPAFALPGLHAAYLQALGPAALLQGQAIPPFLAMPAPGLMLPVMGPVSGAGYSGGGQLMNFDIAPGAANNAWTRNVGSRVGAKRFEKMLKENDFMREQFELSIGGRIVDWGRHNDGKFVVERFPNYGQPLPMVAQNPQAANLFQMLAGMDAAVAQQANRMGLITGVGTGLLTLVGTGNPLMALALGGLTGITTSLFGGGMGGAGMGMGMGNTGFGALGMPGFGFNMLGGGNFGSLNPLAAPGHVGNTNPAYEAAHQAQVMSVLNDPSLSVEDKVMLMLSLIMKKMDDDIERQMQYINALQNQQAARQQKGKALGAIGTIAGAVIGGPVGAGIGGGIGGKLGGGGQASPSVDVEMQKLQRLITKRAQLFEMASNIMKKYDDTARAAIQKINQ